MFVYRVNVQSHQISTWKVGIAGKAIVISSQGAVAVVCGNAGPSAHII